MLLRVSADKEADIVNIPAIWIVVPVFDRSETSRCFVEQILRQSFQSFRLVIIDHGNNYHTVYAHLEEVFKTTGDLVKTGEVIATVGDTGLISGVTLHFEIRHHGKPLDPLHWLKHG